MLMKTGVSPSIATAEAIKNILRFYPDFSGAVLAVNLNGEHGMLFFVNFIFLFFYGN